MVDVWTDTVLKFVYFSPVVIASLADYYIRQEDNTYDPKVEHGAFLIGQYIRLENSSYEIYVDQLLKVIPENNSSSTIEFGSQAWTALDDVLSKNPDSTALGWFHTHPGHGIFLSPADLNVSYTYFNRPYQIALLLDNMSPVKNDSLVLGIFSFKNNGEINNYLQLTEGV